MPKSIRAVKHRFLVIKSRLACLDGAFAVDSDRSSSGFLILDFLIGNGLWDNIDKKLKIIKMRDCACCILLEEETGWKGGNYRDLGTGCYGGVFART